MFIETDGQACIQITQCNIHCQRHNIEGHTTGTSHKMSPVHYTPSSLSFSTIAATSPATSPATLSAPLNSVLVGATATVAVIAAVLTCTVILLITFIMYNKRIKKIKIVPPHVNSFHMSSQTNIYEEFNRDSPQPTAVSASSIQVVPLPHDEWRRGQCSGMEADDETSKSLEDTDYAIVSDEVDIIRSMNALSSADSVPIVTCMELMNETMESEYSLIGEGNYMQYITNTNIQTSCTVDAELNKNGVEESIDVQGECPIYSVVNKNGRASSPSESCVDSGQDQTTTNTLND